MHPLQEGTRAKDEEQWNNNHDIDSKDYGAALNDLLLLNEANFCPVWEEVEGQVTDGPFY